MAKCDVRPAVTFPAAERYRSLTGTKSIPLRDKVTGREQLALSQYKAVIRLKSWTHDPLNVSPMHNPIYRHTIAHKQLKR